MTKDDILTMASESYCWRINLSSDRTASLARLQRFAELVAAKERNRTWTQDHWTEYERSIAATEREACASIEVHLTTPDRDYTNMSPLDAYETALMDAAIAFREAIRARGQSEIS
jgi:hypothetical protein